MPLENSPELLYNGKISQFGEMNPMSLSGSDIRTLRQRLGWSLAEMARQMGCTTELIVQWEAGASRPDAEALNQLHYLQGHVEQNSRHLAEEPACETRLESRRLTQVTHRDLLKDN
jgi:transcriptional regulator with XRE-family HTH domain